MKKIKQLIMVVALAVGVGLFAVPSSVSAVNAIADTCSKTAPDTGVSLVCDNKNDNVGTVIGAVVNTLLFLLGIAAVIVIIIGGITYTTSAGSEQSIVRAKNMILFAVIGLVVAFAAYAIVNWVIKVFV